MTQNKGARLPNYTCKVKTAKQWIYHDHGGLVLYTAGWRQTYHSENLEKTIPTKVSAVLDTYGYAKLAGTKKFGCLPSSLAARGVFVPSKSRLSKSAIFYPKKWFFGNSDTTFTLTKFFRLHFVQMS